MLSELWPHDARHDQSLTIKVPSDDARPACIVVRGELDGPNAEVLQATVVDLLRRLRPSAIEIDLAGVTFLDSAGIRALLLSQADGGQMGCRLMLCRPQPMTYRVLQIAGLLEHFGLARPATISRL